MQYTQDYDEQLPPNGSYNATSRPSVTSYDVAIAPYAGVRVASGASPAIFRCPSDVSADGKRSYAIPYFANFGPGSTPTFLFGDYGTLQFIGVKLADIPEPARTILLAEYPSSLPGVPISDPNFVNNIFGNYSNSYVQGPDASANHQERARPGQPLHFEGWNYLFSDGHVKWMRPQQTKIGVTTNLSQRVPGNLWIRIKE